MSDSELVTILNAIIKMPAWVRADLGAKDPALKSRAEDALAAMISTALDETRNLESGQLQRN